MSADEPAWGFGPPPFNVQNGMQRLRRELREMGLAEREGVFERRGQAIAKAGVDAQAAAITAAVVRKPVRSSPEWQASALKSSADIRDFVAGLKRKLAQWSDSDE